MEDSEIINKHLPTLKKHFNSVNSKWSDLPPTHRTLSKVFALFLIIAIIPITVNLSQRVQNLGSHAAANCSTSLQSQINSAATGGTVDVTGCTFNEAITINKSITLIGGKIDGQNSRQIGISVTASNVTINGTEVLNHATPLQRGAIEENNVTGLKLINVHSHNNAGPGVSLSGGSGHRVTGGEYDHNIQEGYHVTGVSDVIFDGVKIDNNNLAINSNSGPRPYAVPGRSGWYWPVEPFWEAGAGKTTNSTNVTFQNNIVYNNGGVGIWYDINGNNAKILNNYVYNNDLSGIMYEISTGVLISGNKVWNNSAYDGRGWGWPANILVSSSKNAEVSGNIVGSGYTGISVISQDRAGEGYGSITNNYVHDNTVLNQSTKNIGWYDDHGGATFNDTTNRGSGGMYEVDGSKFEWNSSTTNLAGFNATRGDEGGRIISATEKTQAAAQLTAPAVPPATGVTPPVVPPAATNTPVIPPPTQTRAPYPQGSSAKPIPGFIQAEDYDLGGEGIGYHDVDTGNAGAVYRTDNVDIKASTDTNGGYSVGWFAAGEYLTYSVNVTQTVSYDIQFRIGSTFAGRTIHLEVDGTNVTGTVNVPQMANWDQYQTVVIPKITLNKGAHIIKLVNDGTDFLDFNWINIVASVATPTNTPPVPTATKIPLPTATKVPVPTATKTPTATNTPPVPTNTPIVFDPNSIQAVAVSSSNTRSNPVNLLGSTLSDKKYIFISNATKVTKVRFWLDNQSMSGTPRQTETSGPFDFAGTAQGNTALSFDTHLISNGQHTITAAIDTTSGSFVINAVFKVNNTTPTPNGLAGAYYLNRTLSGTPLYRIDPTINFNWGQTTAPISGIGTDNYSIRWTGFVVPKYSETYTFYSNEDDGLRLWVNNVLIIDEWHGWDQAEHKGTIKLNANQKYSIKVEYYEQGGSALETLSWSSPSTPKAVTPQSQLLLY